MNSYTKYQQLGEKGKEGTTYLVKDKYGKEYAMKTFNKKKSPNTLKNEYLLQKKASGKNITPHVYSYDPVSKYIVMDKMDKHLYDDIKKTGILSKKQQLRILEIFEKLDESNVFHGDANLLNYMVKNEQIYIIDFGFSKEITPKLIKQLETNRPNYHLMTIGFILKLKELEVSKKSYKYLIDILPNKYIQKYNL